MTDKKRGKGTYKYRTQTNFQTNIPITNPIQKIQIDYETDNFIRINRYRQAKISKKYTYHDTFKQAVAHVKKKAEQQILNETNEYKKKIDLLTDILHKINNLKEKEL